MHSWNARRDSAYARSGTSAAVLYRMRSLQYLIVFGGGLTALLAALPAAGQSRDNSCKIYFVDDRSTPTDVKALLAAQGDSTAKVCAPETENISYATISAVWKGARGACIFQQGPTRYLKLNEQAGSYSTFMASGRADCPKQD